MSLEAIYSCSVHSCPVLPALCQQQQTHHKLPNKARAICACAVIDMAIMGYKFDSLADHNCDVSYFRTDLLMPSVMPSALQSSLPLTRSAVVL